jgi:hypothetical protein
MIHTLMKQVVPFMQIINIKMNGVTVAMFPQGFTK